MKSISEQKKKIKEEEEFYDSLLTYYTLAFILTDSIMVFDLVFNIINLQKEEFFIIRFFCDISSFWGTVVIALIHFASDYCDCGFSCNRKGTGVLNFFLFICSKPYLLGGFFFIISYIMQIYSFLVYLNNKNIITNGIVIVLMYLISFTSTITLIIIGFLIVYQPKEKIKEKIL